MPAGARVADGAVTLGTTSAVTVLTAPVTTGSAFAAGAWVRLAGSAWVVDCGAATVSWTVWGVAGLLVLGAEAAVPFVVFWLAGAGWAAGCDPLVDPWTALPAAATVDPAVDPAAEATADTAEVAGETTGGTAIGFCAADAGRAKITVRIKPSMKVRARPPQAYKHARRVQAPTFVSPTLKRMGTFPSTARKLRKTLRYLATAPELVTRR
jgi:hypothetical protein